MLHHRTEDIGIRAQHIADKERKLAKKRLLPGCRSASEELAANLEVDWIGYATLQQVTVELQPMQEGEEP